MAHEQDGPGQVERKVIPPPAGSTHEIVIIRLWNFDTDKSLLKEAHKSALLREVDRMRQLQIRPRIFIRGMASRLDDTRYNEQLGKRRAGEVQRFLLSAGVRPSGIQGFDAPGETLSSDADPDGNSAWDRAVELQLTLNPLPNLRLALSPPEVERDLIVLQPQRLFKLQVRFFFRAAVPGLPEPNPFGLGGALFRIWDTGHMFASDYAFGQADARFSIGSSAFPGVPSFSITREEGPFTPFTTSSELGVADFSGPARMLTRSVGVPGASVTEFLLFMFPFVAPIPPVTVAPVRSGSSIGNSSLASRGVATGDLMLVPYPTGPIFRYSGPQSGGN